MNLCACTMLLEAIKKACKECASHKYGGTTCQQAMMLLTFFTMMPFLQSTQNKTKMRILLVTQQQNKTASIANT